MGERRGLETHGILYDINQTATLIAQSRVARLPRKLLGCSLHAYGSLGSYKYLFVLRLRVSREGFGLVTENRFGVEIPAPG